MRSLLLPRTGSSFNGLMGAACRSLREHLWQPTI